MVLYSSVVPSCCMRLLSYLLIFFLCTLTWCVKANSRIPLSISVSNTWMPYVYLNEQRELDGRDYALLSKTLDELGYALERVESAEQNRRLFQVQQSFHDVQLGAHKPHNTQDPVYFSIPYRQKTIGLFYMQPELFSGSPGDLEASLREQECIGAANEKQWYGEDFQALKEQYPQRILHVESQVSQLRMLQKGRVGFVIGDVLEVKALASKLNIDNLMQHPYPVFIEDIHFVFNKEKVDQNFMIKFNQALRARLREY